MVHTYFSINRIAIVFFNSYSTLVETKTEKVCKAELKKYCDCIARWQYAHCFEKRTLISKMGRKICLLFNN